jgi:hypothetical protein
MTFFDWFTLALIVFPCSFAAGWSIRNRRVRDLEARIDELEAEIDRRRERQMTRPLRRVVDRALRPGFRHPFTRPLGYDT